MDVTFLEIDALRRRAGLTVTGLCRRADVPVSTWWRVATGKKKKWWPATVKKLRAGLTAIDEPRLPSPPPDLIATTYRGYAATISSKLGEDPELILKEVPGRRATSNDEWSRAAKIRGMAVYCTVIELDLRGAEVARAIGMTRQAVSQILKRVEDERDDPVIDAIIENTSRLISGRAA